MGTRSKWQKCVLALVFFSVFVNGAAMNAADRLREQDRSTERGKANPVVGRSVSAAYARLPLSFEKNVGQTDAQVRYTARGQGYLLFLTPTEAVLALRSPDTPSRGRAASDSLVREPHPAQKAPDGGEVAAKNDALHLGFVGANPDPRITGDNLLEGRSNYFVGDDPRQWHTNVPNYARVKYESIYPGIDLVYYGNQIELEFDLVVSPGADPNKVRFNLLGARKLALNSQGDLVVSLGAREISLHKPVLYQTAGQARKPVEGHYVLGKNHQVAFEAGPYNTSRALIIDPTLAYSTFLGGSDEDQGKAIAVDASGNAYIAGNTASVDFPTLSPFATAGEIFVTKLNPTGSALIYSSYFGGSISGSPLVATNCGPWPCLSGLAIDSAGNAYITGVAYSGFPAVNQIPNACDASCQADGGTFVAKINAAGSAVDYASVIGGGLSSAIAVDSSGSAYVVGETFIQKDFPIVNALQPAFGGATNDAFLFKVNAAGSQLVYSTFLGGNGVDQATGVAVDASGNAYVAGTTFSLASANNFPTVNQIQGACVGSCRTGAYQDDVFISKINASGSALTYSSLLGGSGNDSAAATGYFFEGASLALDPSGNAYVAGITAPNAGTNDFPSTTGAFQATPLSCTGSICTAQGFVTKINSSGTALVYSTFFGTNNDMATDIVTQDIAVDSSGDVAIVGEFGKTFPLVNPLYPNYLLLEPSAAVLNPAGSALLFSSNLTQTSGIGAAQDGVFGVTFESPGNLFVTGGGCSAIPVTAGAFQSACKGTFNAFVANITFAASTPPVGVSPASLMFASQTVGTNSASQAVTLTNNGTAALAITGISVTGTDAGDFSETNTCGSSVAVGASCAISVVFKPTATGSRTASLSIADSAAGSPQLVALTGTATAAAAAPGITLFPTTLTFPSQTVGATSQAQTVTLTSSGTAALSITSITIAGTDPGDYSETNTCGSTVAAGANCTISVIFKPAASGTRTASVSIADNASGSPHTVPLSGTGAAAPAPGFSLSASPATLSVAPGAPGTSTLTVTPVNGFNQAVAFACTGLPSMASCSFSPSSVTPSGAAVKTTLTLDTAAASSAAAQNHLPENPSRLPAIAETAGLFGCIFLLGAFRSRASRLLSMLILMGSLGLLLACGGGGSGSSGNPGTPAGTYSIVVTATSGTGSSALSQSSTIALTVQ
jgi:Abnormal spindle-like microcephaly-assoc'd, ASPM-SPD-2-Hydin/Beta-propeller repeat